MDVNVDVVAVLLDGNPQYGDCLDCLAVVGVVVVVEMIRDGFVVWERMRRFALHWLAGWLCADSAKRDDGDPAHVERFQVP